VFQVVEPGVSRFCTRRLTSERGRFVAHTRDRPPGGGLLAAPFRAEEQAVPDPTEHLTFQTPTRERFYGRTLWSDLHHSELDAALPEPQRRVVVTVMKAVEDGEGRFAGVIRVGLLVEQIEDLVRQESERNAPHRIFICDDQGRPITRLSPGEPFEEQADESLRVAARRLPPEVAAALRHPALARVRPGHLTASGDLAVSGERFLVSFRGLGRTQGWRVVILVPEQHYLRDFVGARNDLLRASAAVMALILLGGFLALRGVRRGLAQIVGATGRMRNFDFAPSESRSAFRDVDAVMESLELAKTAMRALGKYVPVDLVRHLYQTKREPVLGGELAEVSLMFTDIKDFTALSETLSPDELAQTLGRYLEVMTAAIHGTDGVIDKYVGDAIMAVWNSPRPCAAHAHKACQAALDCIAAGRSLFESEEWRGRPPLVTRFGLHRDVVLVGHFGAPDRMSFTALGDGVNLASRLEGLNKLYGTTVMASETTFEQAKDLFEFRLLDRVAVKGKSRGVHVYELLGRAGQAGARSEVARRYREALDLYWGRDFTAAAALLSSQADDPPSAVLLERCRKLIASPPPAGWDGIYVAREK
jgi:adenylate cyclase